MVGQRFALGLSIATWLFACGPDGGPPPPTSDCRKTGCSGEICALQKVVTTCEWRPVYACYQDAVCGLRRDGRCGFLPSARLAACLAGASGCTHLGQHHPVGEGFPAGDGCNQCSCVPGGRVICTLKACPDGGGASPG